MAMTKEQRVKNYGEVFTPCWLVNQMLDKLEVYSPDAFSDVTKTYLDPSCGTGNILVEVIKRKLCYATPEQALSTTYGCDIMGDSIITCRTRLIEVIRERTPITEELVKIAKKNIVHTPLDVYPRGALDYLDMDECDTFQGVP